MKIVDLFESVSPYVNVGQSPKLTYETASGTKATIIPDRTVDFTEFVKAKRYSPAMTKWLIGVYWPWLQSLSPIAIAKLNGEIAHALFQPAGEVIHSMAQGLIVDGLRNPNLKSNLPLDDLVKHLTAQLPPGAKVFMPGAVQYAQQTIEHIDLKTFPSVMTLAEYLDGQNLEGMSVPEAIVACRKARTASVRKRLNALDTGGLTLADVRKVWAQDWYDGGRNPVTNEDFLREFILVTQSGCWNKMYRSIRVPKNFLKTLKPGQDLGIYWSDSMEGSSWFGSADTLYDKRFSLPKGDTIAVMFVAQSELQHIDMLNTIGARISWALEEEICLKPGTPIKMLDVFVHHGDNVQNASQWKPARSVNLEGMMFKA